MESMSSNHKGIIIESIIENSEKSPHIWKLINILLNKPWIKEEIKGNFKSNFRLNENTTDQKMCDLTKAVLRGKFIA